MFLPHQLINKLIEITNGSNNISSSADRTIKFFDFDNGKLLNTINNHNSQYKASPYHQIIK